MKWHCRKTMRKFYGFPDVCCYTDGRDKTENEHRDLRKKYYELKKQHDELTERMKYFSKVTFSASTLLTFVTFNNRFYTQLIMVLCSF